MHHIPTWPKPREIPALGPIAPIASLQPRREVSSLQSIRRRRSFNASLYRSRTSSRPREHVEPIRRPGVVFGAGGGSGRVESVSIGAYSYSGRGEVGEGRKGGDGGWCLSGKERVWRRRGRKGRWECCLSLARKGAEPVREEQGQQKARSEGEDITDEGCGVGAGRGLGRGGAFAAGAGGGACAEVVRGRGRCQA